jgi:hypothetical protein
MDFGFRMIALIKNREIVRIRGPYRTNKMGNVQSEELKVLSQIFPVWKKLFR